MFSLRESGCYSPGNHHWGYCKARLNLKDLSGPYEVTLKAKSYIMLVRDNFTTKSWSLLLATKSDAYMKLKDLPPDVPDYRNNDVIL